jgi:hypothetical protein
MTENPVTGQPEERGSSHAIVIEDFVVEIFVGAYERYGLRQA